MENYKFFRERNADSVRDEYEIIVPTSEELEKELKNKLVEKLSMIDVIFDSVARAEYLKVKGKDIPKGVSEVVVKQKIGLRVLVDFLDLTISLCMVCGFNYEELLIYNDNYLVDGGIFKELFIEAVNKIASEKTNEENIKGLAQAVMMLVNNLKLDIDVVEEERLKVEKAEGSFLNGKILKPKSVLDEQN